MKKYYVKTYGCQANEADSSSMAGMLESIGFEPITLPKCKNETEELLFIFKNVDLFVVNTCSVRQKSEDKVYGLGKPLSALKRENKHVPFVVMSGCMVGSVTGERKRYEFEELNKRTPWVDLYINPSQINELPNLLVEKGIVDTWLLAKLDRENIANNAADKTHAYVNISYGCDNFCTFCVVPYARGEEKSRSSVEILNEISRLIKRGTTSVTLCGQNVNSWGLARDEKRKIRIGSDQKLPFAQLLRDIHALEGIKTIDFISSNPFDFTNDLLETIKLPKLSNYFHIAVQSGNDEILTKMNRRHKAEDFKELVARIRKVRPDAEIGTDLIVGFPTETRGQFMDTVELVKAVGFSVAFISMYSVRKGTPAEKFFKDDVTLKEKKWRHDFLTKAWTATKPARRLVEKK